MFAASKSGRVAGPPSYFSNVPLLLETTSTNGQQNNTFLDSSSNTFSITRNGTPTQGSVTPYWPNGYWSNYFNGTSYLSNASNGAFTFGTADFTVEYWVYLNSLPGSFSIVCGGNLGSGTDICFGFNPSSPYCTHGLNWPVYTTTPMPLNAWTHLAFTRASGTWKVYINGIDVTTGSQSNPNVTTTTVGIGARSGGGNGFTGWLSGLRVIKGQALNSTGNFTPPTSPVTSTTVGWTGANVASSITGTVSLLTCRSNRFIDGSPSPVTLTVNSNPTVQAFQPLSPTSSYTTAAYGGSGYFNGSTDYLSIADNTALQLGSGEFTIEGWFYFSGATSTAYNLISKGTATTGWSLNTTTGARIQFSYTTSNLTGSTTTLTQGVWYHIAVVRISALNIRIYINGVQEVLSGVVSDNFNQTDLMYISASRTATLPLNGYSSNVRVVKGTAVYTGAFSPPTLAPITTDGSTSAASYSSTTNVNTSFASSATSLLTNYTNAGIYDAAVQNNLITVGDAQSSTTQYKWSPTSMKYDGTGDWLTAIDNPQQQLGTGDFTIEGWVYLSATGVAYGIISKGTASTGWSVNVTSGNKLQFSYTASNLTGATSLAATTWYYFAVVRSGSATGNLKIYLNGTVDATSGGAVTDAFTQTNTLYVGADRIGTSALNGYLQDIRITKGIARTITTPTSAFPTK
jgi:hypothetical protein